MLPNEEPDNSIAERLKKAHAEVERLNQEAREKRVEKARSGGWAQSAERQS